jgi:uncharacterized membrane protein
MPFSGSIHQCVGRPSCARIDGVAGPLLNIYVPTTPNPTSGFHLIVPESSVRESGLSVEEAFKTILSLGIAHGGPESSL